MRVDVDLVVHAKIGKFILIQLSFLLLLNFILDTIDFSSIFLARFEDWHYLCNLI